MSNEVLRHPALTERQYELIHSSRLVSDAWVYAKAAHAAVGQKRKYTGEPYIVHTYEVACLVASVPYANPNMVAAAFLHDVIEDTQVTFTDIHLAFGIEVATLAGKLTDVKDLSLGNRAERKALDRERLACCGWETQTIKLADLISNTKSIVAHDPHFAKVYLAEKQLLLEVLTDGDRGLREQAFLLCEGGLAHLEKLRLEKALEKNHGR
jgi:(p)ppGpp synthase/HD superfamily hydrolase